MRRTPIYIILVSLVALVGVCFGAAEMPKLAISSFKYKGEDQYSNEFNSFNDMLRTAFVKTRRFEMVERIDADAWLKEQGLGDTGVIDASTAQQMGTALGADYIIYGSIAEAVDEDRDRGDEKLYRINVDLSIVHAKTGEIKTAEFIDLMGYGTLKQIMRQTINKMVAKTTIAIYPLKVAAVLGNGTIILNHGGDIIKPNASYEVFKLGETIVDPDSGIILAQDEQKVGSIQTVQVLPKISKAKAVEDNGIDKGMICRPLVEGAAVVVSKGVKNTEKNNLGRIRVVIGQFKYSNEFDMRQTKDRYSGSGGGIGSLLGAIAGAMVAEEVNDGDGAWVVGGLAGAAVGGQAEKQISSTGPDGGSADMPATKMVKHSGVLREMVHTRFSKSGQFDVLERANMDRIMAELSKSQDGNFNVSEVAQRGNLLGAKYIIFGTITKLAEDKEDTGYGFIGDKNSVVLKLTVELRIVETETGSTVFADTVTGHKKTTRKKMGLFGFGSKKEEGGGLGDLMSSAAAAIVRETVTELRPITLISVDESGMVMINYGDGVVNRGDRLNVYTQGSEVRDPYTGEVLARKEKLAGALIVSEVVGKYSNCKIVDEDLDIAPGMICRLASMGSYGPPHSGNGTPSGNAKPVF